MKKKVAFHTLGCKLNFSETATIASQMEAADFEKVPCDSKADVYVINTCFVTENADKRFKEIVKK
ncbi:MAG: tRNA (N(6)-L-threonylcarbamoyladenosine(37)-C(2))-methylthiotransferase MtaB, partial [Flavobacteriaceae bacterium]|nr:tRNA (N(6)-L-threonylcarbamoyladenosine(37)-C(2))-methylthiotransferase MtaB [Flavobacteriaceae bacterium]